MLSDDPQRSVLVEFRLQIHPVEENLLGETTQFVAQFKALQLFFSDHVQALSWKAWPEPLRSRLRSIQVEAHEQMRLLATDVMFWQIAKAPLRSQKQQALSDRFVLLRGYCDALLQLMDSATAAGEVEVEVEKPDVEKPLASDATTDGA